MKGNAKALMDSIDISGGGEGSVASPCVKKNARIQRCIREEMCKSEV